MSLDKEFLQNLMQMPEEVMDAILAEQDRLRQSMEAERGQWEEKYHREVFSGVLKEAVTAARGRNFKAIAALLDTDAIQGAEDVAAAARSAVAELKKSCGYLFEGPAAPGFAAGTGAMGTPEPEAPQTLAGALREKFCR